MIPTCLTCIHYQKRFNNHGDLAYTFCQKHVNTASSTFSCIWHTVKDAS